MAAFAAFMVLVLAVLTASPTAHDWIHATKGGDHTDHRSAPDHVCAVTLAQQGFCDTTPLLARAPAPAQVSECGVITVQFARWTAPDHWLQPAQGPPAR